MSFRHKVNALIAGALVLATTGSPALADDGLPLARIARDLGYAYTYLPYENAVALYRPGATIVVRPGDGFFSANERREPVYGMIPVYRNNDVYVSKRFVGEIRNVGRRATERTDAAPARDVTANGAVAPAIVRPPLGHVESIGATYDAVADAIVVRGRATPGSLVALAVRATLAATVPAVTVDSGATYARADGSFATRLGFGIDQYPESTFVVDASGLADAKIVSTKVPARVR